MSKKIDERLPQGIGSNVLPAHASIRSPWEKLYGYRDTMHYAARYGEVVSAAILQGLRILIPDYERRAQIMCEAGIQSARTQFGNNPAMLNLLNIHPFCRGNFIGSLFGDLGDEGLLMCGRVNDFGTYRVEKELDVCDWDICGSELCRQTVVYLGELSNMLAENLKTGPKLEYCMVEAKGCGDRHCRVVAECREKFPMPDHKLWQSFGPIATDDQIKFTTEEDTVAESMVFREECNYTYANGTNVEQDPSSATRNSGSCSAISFILPALKHAIELGEVDETFAVHVLKCVCEAAGKAAFGAFYTREGLRQWMGVPKEIGDDDGRVMGGQCEMYLQTMRVPYEVEAFNAQEVVYIVDRNKLNMGNPKYGISLMAFWHGAVKTLVNAQWDLWEEPADTPEDKIRIKIAKKIDKFC